MGTIEIVSPAGRVQRQAAVAANPVPGLRGARIGVLDNGKSGARRLAELLVQRLDREHGVQDVRWFGKDNAAVAAQPALLDEIARSVDLVLTGTAD